MDHHNRTPAKQPHIAWRISQGFLHVLGRILLWVMVLGATLAAVAAVAGIIFYNKFSDYLKTDIIPKAEEYADSLQLDNISLPQTSILYCRDPDTGTYRELQQLYSSQNRIWVSYEDIPKDLIHAAVAIEDRRFLEHDGVDWLRTLSAVQNFVGGDSSFGGSSITQQLIKNLSSEDDVTISRKVQEIFRALAVEKQYTKDEIMEWYLNTIYLGEGCYGVQSAAKVYFAKDVSELTTAECACLIAITNNPSMYDPYIAPNSNEKRRRIILSEMYDQGYIDSEEAYLEARDQELELRNGLYDSETYLCAQCGFEGERSDYNKEDSRFYCPQCATENPDVKSSTGYSYFVDTVYRDVVSDLCDQYELSELAAQQLLLTSGWKIYTTLDPEAQAQMDEVYENLENVPNTVSVQQLQSAMVLISNETGDIIAMKGGVGEKEGSLTFNRAESRLPTGSSIKPISVYAPALEAGLITPASVYEDSSLYDSYDWPQNESRSYSGLTNVLTAVKKSLNTVSVKVLNDLTVEASYAFLTQKLGITTLVEKTESGGQEYTDLAYAPLGLGELTYGMTVREMTQAYATFPNGGVFREARTYTSVIDQEGNIILDNTQESHTAMSEKTSYYINYMLREVVSSGTGTPAYIDNMSTYGKTGTSNNNQSRWFAGYTPYYTAVVWCGYDEMEQIVLADSYTNPAIVMWRQVMRPLHEGLEWKGISAPNEFGTYTLCADCGKLAEDFCENEVRGDRTVKMPLHWQDAPKDKCDCHIEVQICEASGKLCNDYCSHVAGNKVNQVSMLIFNEDWKEKKDEDYVYNPEKTDNVCTLHNKDSATTPSEDTPGSKPNSGGGGNRNPDIPQDPNGTPDPAPGTTVPETSPGTSLPETSPNTSLPESLPSTAETGPPPAQWYEGPIRTGG